MSWHEHVNRGTLAMVRSDYGTAERELNQALAVAKRECADKSHHEHNDNRVRNTLGLLGQVHLKQSHYDQAQELLSRSVDGDSRGDGSNELVQALYLISLSVVKRQAGDASGANYRFQQAVDSLHPSNMRDAHAAVQGLNQLFANVQRAQHQQFQHQFKHLQGSAQIQKANRSGKRQPSEEEIARLQNSMADAGECLRLGNEQADIAAYNRALEATKLVYRMFDHDQASVAACLSLLGACSQRLHMYDQAEALYKRAATIYGDKPGKQSEHAAAKLQLAALYAEIFDYCQSLQYLTEVMETGGSSGRSELEQPGHILTMMARAELYASCRETIRHAIEAEEADRLEHGVILYGRAITLLQRILPSDHLEIAQTLYFKSNVLRRLGQIAAADQVHHDAEEIEEKNHQIAKKWEKVAQSVPPFRIPPSRSV